MTRVYPAIVNWREQKVETCPRRSPSFENFLGKKNSLDNFFSLHTTTVLNIPNDSKRSNLKDTNIMKCYSSDEPARGFLGNECRNVISSARWKLKLASNDYW